jgi:hypothetical protein
LTRREGKIASYGRLQLRNDRRRFAHAVGLDTFDGVGDAPAPFGYNATPRLRALPPLQMFPYSPTAGAGWASVTGNSASVHPSVPSGYHATFV